MIREWSRGQWALRAVVAAGPVVALLLAGAAGSAPPAWAVLLVLGLALAHARLPESPAGTAAAGLAVLAWVVVPGDPLGDRALAGAAGPAGVVGAVGAAVALVAAHVAALLVAQGPDALGVDPATARLWLRRGAAVCLLAPVVAGLALVLRGRHESIAVWVAGLAVALVVAAGTSAVLSEEDD